MAMDDCMKIQLSDTKRKIDHQKMLIANCGGVNQNKLQGELVALKLKASEEFRLMQDVQQIKRKDEKFKILNKIIFDRFGKDVLEELKLETKNRYELLLKQDEKPNSQIKNNRKLG